MPYVGNEISKEVTLEEKDILKSKIAKILKETAGKCEKYIMVSFRKSEIYLGGKQGEYAYVELKLLGNLTKDQKNEITKQMSKIYKEILGISDVYITFHELERENWGYKDKTFA
ncbi:tautomerase family protein [Haliovirga abyssi]|uniref:L-dopachrome isomerase n=1 Tax=Haliovirga abyssi TaxID=2996794 RepID=A0AAU9DC88_9FUSO|nr:phenylpyruvate tautomerase MIF-related protein [Haliovirga abyssi]BDU51096.1 hypothetical protein HLVA_16650 [Haliovirga abyssi]